MNLSFSHLDALFKEAFEKYPVSEENLKKIHQLDLWVIDKLRVAFGNRIIKQMNIEARYREYKSKLAENLNEEICQQILEQTKEIHLWILQKFLPEKKQSVL